MPGPIPGPRSRQWARRLRRVESRNVTYQSSRFPVFWESASGCHVRDVDGHSYLDLTSAFAVSGLGHSPAAVRKAIARQTKKMWHGMGDVHPNAVKVELLELLASLAPGDLSVSILSSSGADAVESALKTAYLATRRPGVLAFVGGYHGLSYGTLQATHRADFRTPFTGQLAPIGFHALYPDSVRGISDEEALESAESALIDAAERHTPVGAILVEPIQGRGGIRVPGSVFFPGLQKLAKKYGALLIVDEVFTGFGRTGKRFAIEHWNVVPDLLCVGKALGNGFPISACLGSRRLMDVWPPSEGEAIHTSTFLGNPLGCAMALAALKELERGRWVSRAAKVGAIWMESLRDVLGAHPHVGEIRGRGLMIGIELVKSRRTYEPDAKLAAFVVEEALRHGVLLLIGGSGRNVLSLTPPLIITERELRQGTQVIQKALFQSRTSS